MQFLMGLNEGYEAIPGQILIMDPLPSISRAYAMVLQAEDQKIIAATFPDTREPQCNANVCIQENTTL